MNIHLIQLTGVETVHFQTWPRNCHESFYRGGLAEVFQLHLSLESIPEWLKQFPVPTVNFFILIDPNWVHYQCVIFNCENFPSATSRWFIRVLLSFRTMMNINQHCSSGLDVLLGVSQLVPKSIDTTTSRDVKVGASQKLGWSWTGHKVFSDSWSKRHYHNSANTQTMTSLKVNFYG